ncbi:MAG: BON domain-containing protein [Alphaproteobacteria bacterium]|nr:BON domain-containing protein [Alphaproteobacteria bacterium]MBF0250649.1 BON domain-containing protein [Alphaproteobacteria bacterium]
MRTIAVSAALAAAIALTHPAWAIEFNPLSYVKGAVEAAVEDRSAEDIATDTKIKAKMIAAIGDQMGTDVVSINVDVYEQDMMLTGVVETVAQEAQVGRIAKTIEGVKQVYNEVLIKTKLEENKGTVENFVDDTVIETKINAQLLDAKGVNVTNFRWHSVGGHVFLFGRALSKAELDKAVRVVKDIENVTQVTERVNIRPKK